MRDTNRSDAMGDFKRCSRCGQAWPTRAEFLADPSIWLTGYQVNFLDLAGGLLLFDHSCGTTLAISVRDRSDAIVFTHDGTWTGNYPGGKSGDTIFAASGANTGVVDRPEGTRADIFIADRLDEDDPIGPANDFIQNDAHCYGYGSYRLWGHWVGARGYVGLYMDDVDGRHYGWADIYINDHRNEITLHAFAIETTPGETILAGEVPEPASLTLLALGATGVLTYRKRH